MENWAHLITMQGDFHPAQVRSLLQSEKIPFVEEKVGNTELLRIYLGESFTQIDFYVKQEDLERGLELLEAFEFPEIEPDR